MNTKIIKEPIKGMVVRFIPTGIESIISRRLFQLNLEKDIYDYEWVSGNKEDEKYFQDLKQGKRIKKASDADLKKYLTGGQPDWGKIPLTEVR
jgi:hypothetical protein